MPVRRLTIVAALAATPLAAQDSRAALHLGPVELGHLAGEISGALAGDRRRRGRGAGRRDRNRNSMEAAPDNEQGNDKAGYRL